MPTIFVCVSDRYDNQAQTYTINEFRAMCLACFGTAPKLSYDGQVWRDSDGTVVLRPVN